MRVALISDLHGNEIALEAVLSEIARTGVDQIVCLGDVATLGPRPQAILARLQGLGCPCILGNHDEFLLDPQLIRSYSEVPPIVQSVDWCRAQLSTPELDFVRTFTAVLTLQLDQETRLQLFHGSPRSHMEDLLATTHPDDLDRMLAGESATVMTGGHTHIQMLRQHRGILLVNPGSVGLAFKEFMAGRAPTVLPHAEFALVTATRGAVDVSLRRVQLDKAKLRAALADWDTPLKPMLEQQYA